MRNLIVVLLLAMLAPGVAQGQTVADWQTKWDETLKAAREEGKVVVTGPPDAQVRKLLPEAFKKRYGIAMEYQSARGSDSANKMRAERAAGILYGGCGARRQQYDVHGHAARKDAGAA